MKIKSYSHIGKRDNNEDNLGIGENTFIVCDGVGGIDKGEIASDFVVNNLISSLEVSPIPIDVNVLQSHIKNVQKQLNDIIISDPSKAGMATTLAMLYFKSKNALIAHIGDSRIYYIKPNEKKYWRTKDHSLVNELVESGVITEEKALTHSRRNMITRAIQANKNGETVKADIVRLNSIDPGDLIFICSDGVTESLSDENLINILGQNIPIKEKLTSIKNICSSYSNDNNTAIIIKLEEEDAFSISANDILLKPFPIEIDRQSPDANSSEQIPILNSENESNEGLNHKEKSKDNSEIQAPNTENSPESNTSNIEENTANSDIHIEKELIEDKNMNAATSLKQDSIEKADNKRNILMYLLILTVLLAAVYWTFSRVFTNSKDSPIGISTKNRTEKTNKNNKKSNTIKINNIKESDAYQIAKQTGTIKAYQDYIFKFPNGSNINNAKKQIQNLQNRDEVDWENAKKNKNYSNYIQQHPKGKYIKQAKEKNEAITKNNQDEQAFNSAKNKNTIDAYRDYLMKHPNGKHKKEAKEKINNLSNNKNDSKVNKKIPEVKK